MTKYPRGMAGEVESETSDPKNPKPPHGNQNSPLITQPINVSESGTLLITGHKLTGHNFNQWSHSVMIFICGKGKEDYLTGAAVQPEETVGKPEIVF
ncbi:uncharacterized protein J3R85_002082 [Psidium guajava]|nr:uncharacterized protein J3R85_002082 [Psidium guajava]